MSEIQILFGIAMSTILLIIGIYKESVYADLFAFICGILVATEAFVEMWPTLIVACIMAFSMFALIQVIALQWLGERENGEGKRRNGKIR